LHAVVGLSDQVPLSKGLPFLVISSRNGPKAYRVNCMKPWGAGNV
jgi:hypothetical protein